MAAAATLAPECTHEHCVQCIRTSCKYNKFIVPPATAANACPLTQCRQMCGATYHSCKESEHRELCAYERVPCINACYGCPVMLLRWTRGKHLSQCPASVVYCTMQWNRWPVFSAERQVRVPFSQNNFHARYGQLDVALALRDQRVLTEGRKAPHSTRRVLRNRLTERFPAVPLPLKRSSYRESQVTEDPKDECATNHIDSFMDINGPNQDQVKDLRHDINQRHTRSRSKNHCSSSMDTISDDEESYSDAPWMTNKDPPGLCRSILQQLLKPINGAAVANNSHAGNVDISNDDLGEGNLGNSGDGGDVNTGNDVDFVTSHVVGSGDGDGHEELGCGDCNLPSGEQAGFIELDGSNCLTLSIDVVENLSNDASEIKQATLANNMSEVNVASDLTTSANAVVDINVVTDLATSANAVAEINQGTSLITSAIDVTLAANLATSANDVAEINVGTSLITPANDVAEINVATDLEMSASNVVENCQIVDLTTSAINVAGSSEETGLTMSASDVAKITDTKCTQEHLRNQQVEYNGDEILKYLALHNVTHLPSSESHTLSLVSTDNCKTASENCTLAANNFTSTADNLTAVISCPSLAQSKECFPDSDGNNKESSCTSSIFDNHLDSGATGYSEEACHSHVECNSQNPPPAPPYCFPLDPLFTPPFIKCNPLSPTSNFRLPIALQHILALDLNIESIAPYCAKPRSMYTFICAQPFRRDEYATHFGNVHGDIHSGLNGWMEARCPLALYGCTYSVLRLNPRGGAVRFSSVLDSFGFKPTLSQSATGSLVSEDLSTQRRCSNSGLQDGDGERELYPTIDLAHSNQRCDDPSENGDFNGGFAVPSRDFPKYSLLKTEACQNEFEYKSPGSKKSEQIESAFDIEQGTRDDTSLMVIDDCAKSAIDIDKDTEWPAKIFMNTDSAVNVPKVSSEISLNATDFVKEISNAPLEGPAEIASYAEFKRNKPKHKEPTPEIYTSKDYDSAVSVETARIQPVLLKPYHEYIVEQTPPRDDDTFSRLPFEILQYVGRCLDSFSLCNLALTSHYLRDVCRSLVEQRGIVIQEWEKVPAKTWRRHSWVVTYQRWQFSTAFTSIDNWCINDTACISNHLKTCPYFIKAEPKEKPIKLLDVRGDVVVKQDANDSSSQFYPHVVPNRPGYQTTHGKFAEVMTQLASHMLLDVSDEEPMQAEEEL